VYSLFIATFTGKGNGCYGPMRRKGGSALRFLAYRTFCICNPRLRKESLPPISRKTISVDRRMPEKQRSRILPSPLWDLGTLVKHTQNITRCSSAETSPQQCLKIGEPKGKNQFLGMFSTYRRKSISRTL